MHPTVKPVAMVADAIRDCSNRNAGFPIPSVGRHDADCGGTDGLRARLIEIDPLFVDVSIERWQRLTGAPARHAHMANVGRSGSTAMTDKLARRPLGPQDADVQR